MVPPKRGHSRDLERTLASLVTLPLGKSIGAEMKLGRLIGSTSLPVRITYEKIRALKLRAARNRAGELFGKPVTIVKYRIYSIPWNLPLLNSLDCNSADRRDFEFEPKRKIKRTRLILEQCILNLRENFWKFSVLHFLIRLLLFSHAIGVLCYRCTITEQLIKRTKFRTWAEKKYSNTCRNYLLTGKSKIILDTVAILLLASNLINCIHLRNESVIITRM